jgi:hypothetical protein
VPRGRRTCGISSSNEKLHRHFVLELHAACLSQSTSRKHPPSCHMDRYRGDAVEGGARMAPTCRRPIRHAPTAPIVCIAPVVPAVRAHLRAVAARRCAIIRTPLPEDLRGRAQGASSR